MRMMIASLLFLVLAPGSLAWAEKKKSSPGEGFKLIQVAQLSKWMDKSEANLHIYDANGDETRKSDGMIPGAVALASSTSYDLSVLPANKSDRLVFYCYNIQCMASHSAAKRATEAGYTSVFVLSPGIDGWKKAGKKTVVPAT